MNTEELETVITVRDSLPMINKVMFCTLVAAPYLWLLQNLFCCVSYPIDDAILTSLTTLDWDRMAIDFEY